MEAVRRPKPRGGKANGSQDDIVNRSPPVPSPKVETLRFDCPICSEYQTSKRGHTDHVNGHITDPSRPWSDCKERQDWMAELEVAVCPECGNLAGTNPKGRSKGIHEECRKKMEMRKEKAKEAEAREHEAPEASVQPTASFLAGNSSEGQSWCKLSLEEAGSFASRLPIPKSNLFPEKCVPSAAQAFHKALDTIISAPEESSSWVPMALFGAIFIDDSKSEKKRTESVMGRADMFAEGAFDALYDEARPIVEGFESKCEEREARERSEEEMRKDAINKINNGFIDKLLRSKMSAGLADLKDQVNVDELKSKFPRGEEVEMDPNTFTTPEPFGPEDVLKALKKPYSRKRAADAAGITPEIYYRLLMYDKGLLDKLTTVLNFIAASETPPDLNMNLLVRGVALAKVPRGIRPLGIPSLLLSLVASMFAARHKKRLREAFEPIQQALSKGGAEVVVHAIRAFIAMHGDDPDLVLLLLDFLNAFNELERQNFLEALVKEVPEMGAFLFAEYARRKRYVYPNGVEVASTKGLIQGDVMGPANCCAGEKETLLAIKSLIRDTDFLAALMDDFSVIAPQEVAIKVVRFVQENGPAVGLVPNMAKTVAMFTCLLNGNVEAAPIKEWPEGIVIVGQSGAGGVEIGGKEKEGVRSLGSFIGTLEFTKAKIRERIDSRAVPLLNFAVSLHHPAAALEVVKRVTAVTGLDYILRTTPPEETEEACDYFDKLLRDAFERAVVGCVLSDEEWRRAQLPYPHGWNLVPTRIKALAAYTASLLAHRKKIEALSPGSALHVDKTIAALTAKIQEKLPKGTPFLLRKKMRQGELVRLMLKSQYAEFSQHKEERVRVLFNAMSDRRAQAYKSAPSRPGLLMGSDECQVVVRRSLGVNLCNRAGALECKSCGGFLDLKGDHECPKDGAWVKAHNAVRDLFFETARQGLVECKREQRVTFKPECADCHKILTQEEKGNGHPCPKRATRKATRAEKPSLGDDNRIITPTYTADIVFEEGIPGLTVKRTLVDFTIKHEFLPTYRHEESQKLGSAALIGEKEKDSDFKERSEAINHGFVPVALNSLGHMRPHGVDLAYYLIAQRAHHKGMTFEESASLFWHKLSMTIHQAHARNILTRFRDILYHMTVPRT